MRSYVLIFVVVALAAVASQSIAHEHATGVVKERMDVMTEMARHQKAISQHLKNKNDVRSVKADAEAIAESARHVPHLFPKGSTQAPTQARPAIWQSWPDFETKSKALEAAARALAQTDPADGQAMAAASAAVTRACGACHEKYRTRK